MYHTYVFLLMQRGRRHLALSTAKNEKLRLVSYDGDNRLAARDIPSSQSGVVNTQRLTEWLTFIGWSILQHELEHGSRKKVRGIARLSPRQC